MKKTTTAMVDFSDVLDKLVLGKIRCSNLLLEVCSRLKSPYFSFFVLLILMFVWISPAETKAQCTLTLKPTVSGCWYGDPDGSGSLPVGSYSTVSVEVSWANHTINAGVNNTSDLITVTLGSTTKTINPGPYTSSGGDGTIVSPQVVAFVIPANGATNQNIQAFVGANYASSTCKIESFVNAPVACQPTVCGTGQTGGTVFMDYDANGVKSSGETNGLKDVTVKAFDCKGIQIATATTDLYGIYIFSPAIPASAYPIRVEFSGLPDLYGQGTMAGTNGRTTTQFVNAASCSIDLGVIDPNDFCQNNPKVFVPCYVYGNPLPAGSASGQADALVSFNYGTSGPKDMSKVSVMSDADSIGTLWGLAYNKYKKLLYGTATLKRHSGLGPKGLGGLYIINPTNNSVIGIDLATAPYNINFGTIPANGAGGRGLSTNPAAGSADAEAFAKIGKVGIGDIDISEDGKFLYLTNLFDKKLYKLDITGSTPTLAGSYDIPVSCTGGQNRPFGLKVYKEKVYVGTVCDGTTTNQKGDLRAFVQSFDPASNTFATVFDFPLTYPKGYALFNNDIDRTGWYPWTDNFNDLIGDFVSGGSRFLTYPQPMLTDIEFDLDGTMILAFGDRTGFQSGYRNLNTSGGGDFSGISGGDILRASFNGQTYILENNGVVNGIVGINTNNNQGPGFGEFYNDSYPAAHMETAFGALAIKPGSGFVMMTGTDPIPGGDFNAGGIRYLNNATGATPAGSAAGFILYTTAFDNTAGTFSKSTGLGDVELSCDLPTFLEIGNYIWNDKDRDGVQDPCETPISGLKVQLVKNGTVIAEATTNATGNYYFSSKSRLGTGWTGTGADTTLLANTDYVIRLDTTQAKILGYFITKKDATNNSGNDQNDSDASKNNQYAQITLKTGDLGSVNHTYDIGLSCTPPLVVLSPKSQTICNGNSPTAFSVTPDSGIEYKWYGPLADTTSSLGTAISGQTSADYIPSGTAITTVGKKYYAVVVNNVGGTACSDTAFVELTVNNCPCTITTKPTVSGCWYGDPDGSGPLPTGSYSTVNVEVAWLNHVVNAGANNTSDLISVTLGGVTKTINPGPYTNGDGNGNIVSPQVVAFIIPADGVANQTIQAFAGANYNTSTCKSQTQVNAPTGCQPTPCLTTSGQTGGTVFIDNDANGTKSTGETVGLSGVKVYAFDCNGVKIDSAITDSYGRYTFTKLTAANYPIRVEFKNLPAIYGNGTTAGNNGKTTTQFVQSASCGVDLGVLDPNDYCQTNPKLVIPCYVNGDPLTTSTNPNVITANNRDAVVAFDYGLSGLMNMPAMAHAPAKEVGTVWGVAYNRFTRKVFTSATIRRHAGLGTLGIGGIYVSNFNPAPAPGATMSFTPFIDVVADLGVDVGSIVSNQARGLSPSITQPTVDNPAYFAVGKMGIGGIDFSENGDTLYFTNLFDNRLYSVNIKNYNTNGTLPTKDDVKSYDMTQGISPAGGNLRIWAVKVHKGNVYTGIVADASVSQNKSDLRAYVQRFSGTSVSTIFDFPLTYPKGFVLGGDAINNTGWYPWTDDWSKKSAFFTASNANSVIHPEPMFSDIEFDTDGSMVLAFGDRSSVQSAPGNYGPYAPYTNTIHASFVGGDILRAFSKGSTYVLENNAKAGSSTGYGQNNNQGPGFGEFYNDNFFYGTGFAHVEQALGGLAIRPGSGETIATVMDPVDMPAGGNVSQYVDAGGVRWLNNQNGSQQKSYQIYAGQQVQGTFGKATGLGDVVLNCDIPAYLEVGNYVWNDKDRDGVQDPCEVPISGVKVQLVKNGVVIAETTTNANGNYYFSSKSKLGTGWTGTGADTTLIPNTDYVIRIDTTQTSVNGLVITKKDAVTNSGNDQNDSDASKITQFAQINIKTGAAGSVNHTYDFGFSCVNAGKDTVMVCNNGKVSNTLQLSASPQGGTWSALSTNSAGATINASTGLVTIDFANAKDKVFDFVYSINSCKDTIRVTVPNCIVGKIGDYVFLDYNIDGIQNGSDKPVKGIVVELYNEQSGTVLAKDTTDINGKYLFDNLPSGRYRVRFVPSSIPHHLKLTFPLAGSDSTKDSDADTLTGFTKYVNILRTNDLRDSVNLTLDAGLRLDEWDPTGYIYCEEDGKILKGGKITVTGPAGVNVEVVEDGSKGYYRFLTRQAGTFTLTYTHPDGYQLSTTRTARPPQVPGFTMGLEGTPLDKDGIINGLVSIGSLPNADTTYLLNFTESYNPYYLVANIFIGEPWITENNLPISCIKPKGSIGDYVWTDTNQDGIQGNPSVEPPVAGVKVYLYDAITLQKLDSTTTGTDGKYLFSNLNSGSYFVEFIPPAGSKFTYFNAGTNKELDSDAKPNGRTSPITIDVTKPSGDPLRDARYIDAGLLPNICPPTPVCVPFKVTIKK
jgi:SdrD B-like domain